VCRGYGLASIILVSLGLAILLTSLLGANSSTLAVLRHSEGAQTARMAAESLLARGMYELRQKPTYGMTGETLRFTPELADSGSAVLTFDSNEALQLKIPVSVNNLSNSESRPGAKGEIVPARTARLYAFGRYGDETRTVVLDLHIPPYPYAVATAGTFASMGDLSLSGISPDTGDEVPGHLVANSDSSAAVMLGPRTEISGDVVSAGGINLNGDEIEVKGQLRPFEEPVEIPRIPLDSFDPRNLETGGDPVNLDTSFYRDATLEGKVLRVGDLLLGGQVTLDGALVYVEGNLQISGTLGGRGAIVCTGDVTIDGTQSLAADNELALLTGGNLTLVGHGVDTSRLEGLIYCEGDVTVRDSTIQGTLVSQANGSTIPNVVMERVDLVEDPSHSDLSIDVDPTKPQFYMVFKNDGHYEPGSSAAELSDVDTKKGKNSIVLGLAATGRGELLVFPPSGGLPVRAASIDGLVPILEDQLVSLLGPKGAKHLDKDKELLDMAAQLIEAAQADDSEPSSDSLKLDIDPMRFLKFGERIKIRSIRVLESGGDTDAV
jgi:cytoskeletal protein CcmA (bactofilin family)